MSSVNHAQEVVCPSCGHSLLRTFFDAPEMPTHVNFLCDSREVAVGCTRGDIRLALCHHCGLISNTAFDAGLLHYREGYENSLHYSKVFQDYAEELAERLIDEFGLRNKTVVEIGCGQGHFLRMLCDKGDNSGIGFDPSHVQAPESPIHTDNIRIVADLYSERYADLNADFFLCRQTLEHIHNPNDLLLPLRRSIADGTGTAVFFEVPNTSYILDHLFVWDIIYEHTSYFTDLSLEVALSHAGFRVANTYATFHDQYLCIEAWADEERSHPDTVPTGIRALQDKISVFEDKYRGYVDGWRDQLERLAAERKSVVLWGAGSKGVTFLNTFDCHAQIHVVVDVNPKKHGMYIAGTGQRIVAPDFLTDHPADAIIVVNPVYASEITRITESLGLEPEFLYL
ncbi:MAG: class I SAM-dependent methyltransferase [Candidatus Krumholzibacteria bacterium]|nr:class I SAM-dependent methyltransferase [Candidatus Krumholzibacteria bacterium]